MGRRERNPGCKEVMYIRRGTGLDELLRRIQAMGSKIAKLEVEIIELKKQAKK